MATWSSQSLSRPLATAKVVHESTNALDGDAAKPQCFVVAWKCAPEARGGSCGRERIGALYEADPASVQAVLRSLAAPAPATCNLFLQIGPVSDTLAFSATTADEPHLRARTPQSGRVPLRDQG
jgi:hypothetical protein